MTPSISSVLPVNCSSPLCFSRISKFSTAFSSVFASVLSIVRNTAFASICPAAVCSKVFSILDRQASVWFVGGAPKSPGILQNMDKLIGRKRFAKWSPSRGIKKATNIPLQPLIHKPPKDYSWTVKAEQPKTSRKHETP